MNTAGDIGAFISTTHGASIRKEMNTTIAVQPGSVFARPRRGRGSDGIRIESVPSPREAILPAVRRAILPEPGMRPESPGRMPRGEQAMRTAVVITVGSPMESLGAMKLARWLERTGGRAVIFFARRSSHVLNNSLTRSRSGCRIYPMACPPPQSFQSSLRAQTASVRAGHLPKSAEAFL